MFLISVGGHSLSPTGFPLLRRWGGVQAEYQHRGEYRLAFPTADYKTAYGDVFTSLKSQCDICLWLNMGACVGDWREAALGAWRGLACLFRCGLHG